MRIAFGIFTGIDRSLGQVVACVEQVIGYRLEHSINEWGDVFRGSTRAMWIDAYANHDYEDDYGMAFSRYPIYVGFETRGGAEAANLQENLCRALALLTACVISADLKCESLVVQDLSQLVELIQAPS